MARHAGFLGHFADGLQDVMCRAVGVPRVVVGVLVRAVEALLKQARRYADGFVTGVVRQRREGRAVDGVVEKALANAVASDVIVLPHAARLAAIQGARDGCVLRLSRDGVEDVPQPRVFAVRSFSHSVVPFTHLPSLSRRCFRAVCSRH